MKHQSEQWSISSFPTPNEVHVLSPESKWCLFVLWTSAGCPQVVCSSRTNSESTF